MIYIACAAAIILILFIIFIVIKNQIIYIEGYNIRIEESSKSIEMLQEEAIDILSKISKKVKNETDEKVFKDLPKIKNKSHDIYEIDKYLIKLNKELEETLEYSKIDFSKDDINLLNNYRDNKIELNALKEYYNKTIEKYNLYIKSLKRLIIKIFKKLKQKEMFNIEKEIEFEILKRKDNSEEK